MVIEWIVQLTLPQAVIDRPIIYHLIRQFDLLTNIREAHVHTDTGWLILSLQGEPETIQQAIDWMTGQGIAVEVLSKGKGRA